MNRIFVASFTALAGFGTIAAAPVLPESVSIEYRDLDLSEAKDRAELERRVDAAAKRVCGFSELRTGTMLRSGDRNCYREAKAKVNAQLARIMEQERLGG